MPVPPFATVKGLVKVNDPKVGVLVVAIGCGVDSVTAPVDELAIISFAVPVMELTNPLPEGIVAPL